MNKLKVRNNVFWRWLILAWILLLDWGSIEGELFPVVKPAFDVTAEKDGNGNSLVSGQFYKLRECSPIRMDWRQGERTDEVKPPVSVIWSKSIVRESGLQEFQGWILNTDPQTVTQNSFSDVLHQCQIIGFNLPWKTRTVFYK